MRKKILTLATVATLALAMTACGSAQTSNDPTSTPEPTKEVEVTTAPTATTTPTVEPTKEPTVEPTATSTPTPEPTPTEAPVVEDDGTLWAVVEELLPLEASERAAYLESKYSTRYVITVENNLDKLLPESLTAEQKELAYENFLGAMDWNMYTDYEGLTWDEDFEGDMGAWVDANGNYVELADRRYAAKPTGEYYLTLLTDTTTGQAHALWFSIYHNLYNEWSNEVVKTAIEECEPLDFYEIFYNWVEYYSGLEIDINGDGVIGYNEELYVSKTEEPTVEPTETPAEPTSDVDDASNFAILKDMIFTVEYGTDDYYSYDEIASIIETMDESRYVVTAVEGLDPLLKETLTDAQKQSVLDALFADSDNFWGEYPVEKVDEQGRTYEVRYPATPTGEFYTMTLTDTVTGETFAWGFRVTVEANDEPGTYYVHEDNIISILYLAQMNWSRGRISYTDCAKKYTDVFDEKYCVYSR